MVIIAHRAEHPRQSVKSVFDKKLRGETNTDCRRMKRILSDGGNVFQTDELYDGVILIHRHPATLLFLFIERYIIMYVYACVLYIIAVLISRCKFT